MNGWIACDKPSGLTCVKIANIAKRITKQKCIGHIGTLDPLATGIVTFALGEATKLIPYLFHPTKIYEFAIHWGVARDTDDAEGRITQTSSLVPKPEDIERATQHFTGIQQQIPPLYSAIHINGVRAYKMVRKGESVELPSREVNILELQWLGDNRFRVTCQAGTYVRSLARDMAHYLGTVGHVEWLKRVSDGLFSTNSLNLWTGSNEKEPYLHAPEALMGHLPRVDLSEQEMAKFERGMSLENHTPQSGWVSVFYEEKLRGIASWEDNQIKPHRLLWR